VGKRSLGNSTFCFFASAVSLACRAVAVVSQPGEGILGHLNVGTAVLGGFVDIDRGLLHTFGYL